MSGGYIKFGVWADTEEEIPTITRDDLYSEGDTPPIVATKKDPRDCLNKIQVLWTDPDNNYAHCTATAEDEVDQRICGKVRSKNISLLGIHDAELAAKTAWKILAEAAYRFTKYAFTLAYRNMAIEVGDVYQLNDGYHINKRVRIIHVSETANGARLKVEAAEDPAYIYLASDQIPTYNEYEPPTLPELDFPDIYFTESRLSPELNLHICPVDEYVNGWILYYSLDDETYEYLGRCNVDPATLCNIDGATDTTLPAYPAVIHRPLESLTVIPNIDFYELQSVSSEAFFNNLNLIKVEDEIIGFRLAEESDGSFVLRDLIRGLFNTEAVAHATKETFHTLDVNFRFTFPLDLVGKTIHFKALTFYGTQVMQLDEVDSFSYTVQGLSEKPVNVSLARIVDREGFTTFTTDDVDIKVNLASKTQGAGIGGCGIVPAGSYLRDPNINSMELIVRKLDDTELYRESVVIGPDVIDSYTRTITAAMRDGNDSVKVSITPGGLVRADERVLTITKI